MSPDRSVDLALVLDLALDVELDERDDLDALLDKAARTGVLPKGAAGARDRFEIKSRAVDARRGRVRLHYVLGQRESAAAQVAPRQVAGLPVIIVGAGPAGLFCAYELARAGVAAIVLDRGKQVQARRRDLKGLTQHGIVDPDSNYCFGEGGAGTYSDGKLYTRSHKRGDVRDVIEILVEHGAPPEILVDARPHIGSNRLPKVVTALREHLAQVGVPVHFGARVTELVRDAKGHAIGVRTAAGEEFVGRAVVVASGHSATDMLEVQARAGARLEAKPFAMGVRIEHPQAMIDRIQYGKHAGHPKLRAAPYRVAYTPADGRGAYSFCMCPGGWIVPAATEAGGLVVNGMSLSRRDSPYANSGLVVAVELADLERLGLTAQLGPMAGVELQRRLERAGFAAGGGGLRAPATRATDFVQGRGSSTVPASSYEPGLVAADLGAVLDTTALPLAARLREALVVFDRQLRGYASENAVLIGVESRTSSPVRVPRDASSLQSPTLPGLYPCGEGAGYAGGIVSAAMDGMRVARAVVAAGSRAGEAA
ncbi:MAG: NAD(P)/FAD-dependent oxidoreductase [Myxococcales bacterium]|nr:NAD(P)/FAD-dependent oxidoreductase [Myxococcales bacterium]